MDSRSTETGGSLGPFEIEDPGWDELSTTKPGFAHLTDGTPAPGAEEPRETAAQRLRYSRQWFWLLMDRARQLRQRQYLTADAALGRRGEDLAHRYLRARGMTIVARNYTLPNQSGEIDIVARDGDVTVFVEVKSRVSDQYGAPERAVGLDKQERITRAAEYYCYRAGIDWDRVRFDLVSIVFEEKKPKIVHTVDAFFLRRTR